MNYTAVKRAEGIIAGSECSWRCEKWDGLGSILRNGFLETKTMNKRRIKKVENIIKRMTIEDLVVLDGRVDLQFEKLVEDKLLQNRGDDLNV